MSKIDHDFGIIFWLHLLFIILFILTPFLVPYYIVFLLVVLFYIQNGLFKNCVLTKAQLRSRENVLEDELSFYAYYFKKMGLRVNPKKIKKYFSWSLLWIIFIFSIFWQIDLGNSPLWFN